MEEQLEYLKQHHAYDVWRGRNTLEENLFIWKFLLSGNELLGWRAEKIQPLEVVGFPPYIQSIWQPLGNDNEILLSLEVYESNSLLAAHEFLLKFLSTFQSPLMQRQEDSEVGDVAFATPGDTGIVFARANLVISLGNAGRELVPIAEIAHQFDQYLFRRPETAGIKLLPESQQFNFSGTGLQSVNLMPLIVESLTVVERSQWYKFFYPSGEIVREGERLSYRLASAEVHELTVFAINPSPPPTT